MVQCMVCRVTLIPLVVADMDSYAIQIGNKLGSNTLFSNDTLPYSLLQEIRTSVSFSHPN